MLNYQRVGLLWTPSILELNIVDNKQAKRPAKHCWHLQQSGSTQATASVIHDCYPPDQGSWSEASQPSGGRTGSHSTHTWHRSCTGSSQVNGFQQMRRQGVSVGFEYGHTLFMPGQIHPDGINGMMSTSLGLRTRLTWISWSSSKAASARASILRGGGLSGIAITYRHQRLEDWKKDGKKPGLSSTWAAISCRTHLPQQKNINWSIGFMSLSSSNEWLQNWPIHPRILLGSGWPGDSPTIWSKNIYLATTSATTHQGQDRQGPHFHHLELSSPCFSVFLWLFMFLCGSKFATRNNKKGIKWFS